MHTKDISSYEHSHIFSLTEGKAERRTFWVVILTLAMMFIEIIAGWLYHSMALLADGWHMSTHALALTISLLAFIFARRHASDRSFTFGTWKLEVLGGYTSGIILGFVGLFMAYVSVERLFQPLEIKYGEAILIAVIGLTVNLLSMMLLNIKEGRHHPHHHHEHEHEHDHHAHDHHEHDSHDHGQPQQHENLNLKAAYVHVLADAMTSVLAIVALLGGKYMGWNWLDPLMGIAGAFLVIRWTYFLLKETGVILLDKEVGRAVSVKIRKLIEIDSDTRISDLHVWKVGMNKYACIVSIVASKPHDLKHYKDILSAHSEIVHLTVEISKCEEED
ncbi:MAG: CDF family Co(II)/Ni(II) efflux transporter DmeF [Victivallales bacterium]|jgi:cation diffusion facilitator family transporter